MTQTFATRIISLVGDAITTNAIDQDAFTEWLSEEAMNAIDIMNPEMLVSASSTHRLTEAEHFIDSGKDVSGSTNYAATLTTIPTSGSSSNLKVGNIIAGKSGSTVYPERMKVLSIGTGTIEVERGVNNTTADVLPGARSIMIVSEKTFNTRKFKLLEVNRDGYSAKLLPSGLAQRSNDSNSIYFATKRSPVYFIKSGNIHIRPLINGYEQGEIIGLTYPIVKHNMKSATDLPIQAEDFMVAGAARKYLVRSMYEEFAQLPSGITVPAVGGTATDLTTLDNLDSANTIDVATNAKEYDQWFATVAHLIEDEEDVELASAQLQKIATYLQAHQEELATKNAVFASALQKATTKYNWFIAQYDKLTLMYNEKAQILRGVQPQ
tara:strand:+ start:163 stop:1302 length:1140 start_codon:yes stop_codon:yes gene_type:complete